MDEKRFEDFESVEENTELVPIVKEIPKKKRKRKGYWPIAIIAMAINVVMISAVFASGYFVGLRGELPSVNAETNNQSDSEWNKAVSDIVGERDENQRVELTTEEVAKLVGPAVVGIVSEVEYTMNSFWGPSTNVSQASGSGILFKKDKDAYYILTNNHVIEGAKKVSIQVAGDKTYDGEIVGADSTTDLAVVKISTDDELTLAKFGDSSQLQVGERAIAIGNPLGMEFFGSVTQGIISATTRTVAIGDEQTMNYIQTDAAINSGNSGGALVNAYGEVVGVNSAKVSDTSVEGMGFAIPISEASVVADDLVNYGYVKGRPVIGITTVDVTASIAKRYGWPEGVWVNSVVSGSGAEEGGLKRGDIIIEANGKEVKTVSELNAVKSSLKVGDTLKLKVYREGSGNINISIVLKEDNPTTSK